MEHQSYAITVKLVRRVGDQVHISQVAVTYNPAENISQLMKRCEAISEEFLTPFDELIIKKQY